MRTYLHKTPVILKKLYPKLLWQKPDKDKVIYLTFDDGPIPGVTDWVIELLNDRNIKATFFVVGENVKKYPSLFEEVIAEGHKIGNHTYNHLKGWKTNTDDYIANFQLCQEEIDLHYSGDKLFRPPYGRIKPSQIKQITETHDIVMWDYLIGDFDASQNSLKLLSRAKAGVSNGSIVIFHDSLKAKYHLKAILPSFLDHFLCKKYLFKTL